MTAIPHAAKALTSALGRFEHAGLHVLEAATGAGGNPAAALAEMSAAQSQLKAGAAVIRFSDEMWNALIEIGQAPRR